MENKKIFKLILARETQDNYKLVKMLSTNTIKNNGNTERFCEIIADKWLIINRNTKRIENDLNPHLAEKLAAANCNNWRVDNLTYCISEEKYFSTDTTATYQFDTENGTITRKLNNGEQYCKNCSTPQPKSKIFGYYCKNCLTARNGLAYRFGYHSFGGEYKVYEKIDTTKTAVFGCEIERDYLNGWSSNFDNDLQTAMFEVVKTMHAKEIKAKKKIDRANVFMSDGSLTQSGCEWITYPQSYKAYKAQKNKFAQALEIFKKHNFGNSQNVGNHIHINRNYFGSYQNSKINACKLALLFGRFWNEFKAIAKRNNTEYTARPSHKAEDDLFTLVEKSINSQNAHGVAINTQHDNTIEFRIWSGIDNVEDLLLYIDITQSLAMFVKKKSLETLQKCNFVDLFKNIADKSEHITEIITRLKDKNITTHNRELKKLIERGDN